MSVSYRLLFYAIHVPAWILGVVWFFNILQPGFFGVSLWPALFCSIGIYFLIRQVLRSQMESGKIRPACPFCASQGPARMVPSEGLTMTCPTCGDIRGAGMLGWTIMRDKDVFVGLPPVVPKDRMKFDSPLFRGLFGLSLVTTACGAVFDQLSAGMLVVPVAGFCLGGLLAQDFSSGCLRQRGGPIFRSREPLKFWLFWLLSLFVCLIIIGMPINDILRKHYPVTEKTEAAR